ncbi:unnamed protein product [Paramecium pentaurelia]|uniref:Uncharacterized protein n=1 Tax=Paramecium pentaurelia TaxID=43138 RepID=A0A8S1W3A0_9CILI|nr:unnamed protein product [Paramecium pentaurelia]
MSSANLLNHRSVLREKSLNFLNVPIADYLTQQKPITEDSQYKAFQRNLQLQKQILNEQDDVHQYQTELFTKSVKQERVPIIVNRPSVQHFKPTLPNDFAIPNRKSETIIKQITRIDDDLDQLAQIFYQRKLLMKAYNGLEQHAERKNIQIADEHRQLQMFKAFFKQLQKKQMIQNFKKSLKQK